jgi:hypothetical protein
MFPRQQASWLIEVQLLLLDTASADETYITCIINYPLLPKKINNSEKQEQRDLQIQALVADITVEIKGYCYLKLSPSRFRQLERWLLHDSCWVLETWVKLKHHTLNYDTQILIVCRADIYSPLVGVVPTYKGGGKQLAITLNSL